MPLLERLLRLHRGRTPLEDFFSEAFAHLLERHPDICHEWVANLLGTRKSAYTHSVVSTQYDFGSLESHVSGSRPDIVIQAYGGDFYDLVVIESKVGTGEGVNQLRRYAEHVAGFDEARERVLCYMTRDPARKDRQEIERGLPVRFQQRRWHQVYRFLERYQRQPESEGRALIEEIHLFMEENGMSQPNQFSATDIVALTSIPRAVKLMDESLRGEAQDLFEKVTGGSRGYSTASTQLQKHNRYLLSQFFAGSDFWAGLGYFLKGPGVVDYPMVGLMLEVSPTYDRRGEVIVVFKEICQGDESWVHDRLGEHKSWAKLMKRCSLRRFLSEEDQIKALELYMVSLVQELAGLIEEYPNLAWNVA